MKILGIEFKYNLAWGNPYINRIIAKSNSLSYTLRYITFELNRKGT